MKPDLPKSAARRVFDILSGYGLATSLLVLLMVLTWLATLEQVQYGLYPTLEKYFNYRELVVFPDAGIFAERLVGKSLPPLPGGFWVCALLALNLTLGGVIRIRKGWRTAGVLLSHFGIIFMIVAGGVSQVREERGVMMLREGQSADYAQSLTETAIEIMEVRDGKVEGEVHEVTDRWFKDLDGDHRRVVRLPSLPFDLELQGYLQNARPVSAASMAPPRGEHVIDGWFLYAHEPNKETEMDTPGIHARILGRDGSKGPPFLLAVASYQPFTVEADGRSFVVQLAKKLWQVPFMVRLEEARAEFHPNTSRPKAFESDITRIEEGRGEVKVLIEMNEPMRHGGYVFFQRTMEQAQMQGGDGRALSGFEVVKNPADKWPEYSLYISGFGLFVHFVMKLAAFLLGRRSPTNPKTA